MIKKRKLNAFNWKQKKQLSWYLLNEIQFWIVKINENIHVTKFPLLRNTHLCSSFWLICVWLRNLFIFIVFEKYKEHVRFVLYIPIRTTIVHNDVKNPSNYKHLKECRTVYDIKYFVHTCAVHIHCILYKYCICNDETSSIYDENQSHAASNWLYGRRIYIIICSSYEKYQLYSVHIYSKLFATSECILIAALWAYESTWVSLK